MPLKLPSVFTSVYALCSFRGKPDENLIEIIVIVHQVQPNAMQVGVGREELGVVSACSLTVVKQNVKGGTHIRTHKKALTR